MRVTYLNFRDFQSSIMKILDPVYTKRGDIVSVIGLQFNPCFVTTKRTSGMSSYYT